jgi:hypothetical protein
MEGQRREQVGADAVGALGQQILIGAQRPDVADRIQRDEQPANHDAPVRVLEVQLSDRGLCRHDDARDEAAALCLSLADARQQRDRLRP